MADFLIAHGAPVDERRTTNDNTPLIGAIEGRARDVIAMLLAYGADGGASNNRGISTLHFASGMSGFGVYQLELAQSLLAHGAVVNALDQNRETPLHYASTVLGDGGRSMVNFLLENGADVNALSNSRCSPLQKAISMGNERVAALLLGHGADVEGLNRKERKKLSRMITER
jgi:ankyrin repeat protein